METLQEIKNQFAQEHVYKDFESFVIGSYSPENISKGMAIGDFQAVMEVICIRAQKVALEWAAKRSDVINDETTGFMWEVDRSLITDPENLIR